MKRIFCCAVISLAVCAVSGQPDHPFKPVTKKTRDTFLPAFSYRTINHSGALKTADAQTTFRVSPVFSKPVSLCDPSIKRIILSKDSGSPIFIERGRSDLKSAGVQSPEQRFRDFFEATREVTNLESPEDALKIKEIYTDDLGMTHIRAQQQWQGIRIYGAEVILHLDDRKEIFTGRLTRAAEMPDVALQIDAERAIGFAIADLKSNGRWRELSPAEKTLLNDEVPSSSPVIYQVESGKAVLCYEIDIRSGFIETWKYFVDAASGQVVSCYNNTKTDGPVVSSGYDLNGVLRTFDTYLENGTYYMVNLVESMFNPEKGDGIIRTFDASIDPGSFTIVSSYDNTWNNPAAVSLHYAATKTYRYLEDTFGRNSLNNQGMTITGVANLANEDGSGMDNAFWSSPLIYFGNGGTALYNLAGGLDVVAHEMGHGVVENTANLEYRNQPGAINETYADIFGAMVDREDWLIGEDVVKTQYFPSGTMRNMSDPHNGGSSLNDHYWQPAHVSEMYIGEQDNGGVHINNSIGSHAYYLFATAVSKEKAEQVFYRALANYLTTKSQFIDFRIAVVQSAKDLYGENSTEVEEAGKAFDAVGIFDEEQVDYEQEYQENSGDEFILSYDTNPDDPNTLYRCDTNAEVFEPLSTTDMKRRVSVIDNGNVAVFVSGDSKIRSIFTDPENPGEEIISEQEVWDNVAVSRDGNLLACISIYIDTAIYVYDFTSEQWAQFQLYNPTTSHSGTNTGGVLYADAIEFDHSGEYLMYDAYNELTTAEGEPISFWDIGFIRIWDNETGDFGDGSIAKLFGSLPEEISVGNPVFSKNSPNIIAFDYIDAYEEQFAIVGADLLSGEVGVITMNTRPGFPSFSKSDDRILFDYEDPVNYPEYEDIVAYIGLGQNKITGQGDPVPLIADATWGVFYANGTRDLELAPVSNFTVDVKSGNAPLTVQFIDLSLNDPTAWSWTFEGGTPGTSSDQNPLVTYQNPGVFQVSLTCANEAGENTASKTGYISVSENTGIAEQWEETVKYYPNPVTDILHIDCQGEFTVRVYNMLGEKLLETHNRNRVDLGSVDPGFLIIRIDTNGSAIRGKIQKN
ncbi:MAG TPA: PKD domain-containing protein [Bacteroides sp.]|nr:PKD domain-containing protein [Bacteroides sp.]